MIVCWHKTNEITKSLQTTATTTIKHAHDELTDKAPSRSTNDLPPLDYLRFHNAAREDFFLLRYHLDCCSPSEDRNGEDDDENDDADDGESAGGDVVDSESIQGEGKAR
jgi:hypothetical protein